MRLSRHCYDKPRRCPGWAGGGWTSARPSRCNNGFIDGAWDTNYWKQKWTFHRCNTCDVICWPIVVRWLDYTWWSWRLTRRVKDPFVEHVVWPLQPRLVIFLEKLCGWIDRLPAYRRRPEGEQGWHWTESQWGCWSFHLARIALKSETRWNLDVWEPVPEGERDDVHGYR